MNMPTNNSKLLEKVLSKWKNLDKEYSVMDTSDCSNLGDEGENSECDESLCNKHRQMYRDAVATMIISEARADQKAWDKAQEEEYTEIAKRKARADTAKQIFGELDEAVWEQIEPSRLEEFYEQFSNAKDLEASLKVATAFSIIGLDAEKYEALKKKYNIEE